MSAEYLQVKENRQEHFDRQQRSAALSNTAPVSYSLQRLMQRVPLDLGSGGDV